MQGREHKLDQLDRQIISVTQDGLPLVPDPYGAIAQQVGISGEQVMRRMKAMLKSGVIRRLGAVPNHYALGLSANGMSVWDIEDDVAVEFGEKIGELEFVSHCYLRPRRLPVWPYNLFAMVHGSRREEVEAKAEIIKDLLGSHLKQNDILYSTRILKKTGLRISVSKEKAYVQA